MAYPEQEDYLGRAYPVMKEAKESAGSARSKLITLGVLGVLCGAAAWLISVYLLKSAEGP